MSRQPGQNGWSPTVGAYALARHGLRRGVVRGVELIERGFDLAGAARLLRVGHRPVRVRRTRVGADHGFAPTWDPPAWPTTKT